MPNSRTIQKEDLFELQFLNGAALSPDGSQVIYSVANVNAEKNKEFSTLYLLDIASGAPRKMTNGKAADKQPRWSPDGKTIAFVSDRAGKTQLFLLPVDGGEARQLTAFERGIGGSFAWSSDGSQIAFSAVADAEAPDLAKDAYRVDRTVYRFDAIGYLDDQVQDVYLLSLTNGETKQLTNDRTNNSNLRWSPDGRRILYDANMRAHEAWAMTADLMAVDLNGEVSTILDGWASIDNANYTPDGSRVIFVGRPNDGKPIGTKADLYTLDLGSGEIACRTAGLDVGVGGSLSMDMPVAALNQWNIVTADDGQRALATVQRGGTDHVYSIALTGVEDCLAITAGDCAVYPLDKRGDQFLYARTTLNSPPDLFLHDLSSSGSRQLTHLNADHLSTISMPQAAHLQWQSVDSVEVEGWYMQPAIGEAPYPTILYIHGGPHAAYGYGFHFDFQMLAGAGYGVLFLNHRASTGYGDSFSTAIKGDWGNLDYGDLISGVDHAIALGLADAERLGVCALPAEAICPAGLSGKRIASKQLSRRTR